MTGRKGIVLAGGSGSRLWPVTMGASKQLLPVYDKPMIYYPLSVLMMGNIREIAIITTPEDQSQFKRLLGDGKQWGLSFQYLIQPSPGGLAQAYLLAREFLNGAPSAMILGDNIFFGHGVTELLAAADARTVGGTIFSYRVADPKSYGVVDFDEFGRVRSLVEKPQSPPSDYAVTGLYYLDELAPDFAATIDPSSRGELEIIDLLEVYRSSENLNVEQMGRGFAWLDTGTHGSLLEAGNFVRTLTERQGLQVGSPDEIAFNNGWISQSQLLERAKFFENSEYGKHLKTVARHS